MLQRKFKKKLKIINKYKDMALNVISFILKNIYYNSLKRKILYYKIQIGECYEL